VDYKAAAAGVSVHGSAVIAQKALWQWSHTCSRPLDRRGAQTYAKPACRPSSNPATKSLNCTAVWWQAGCLNRLPAVKEGRCSWAWAVVCHCQAPHWHTTLLN